MTVKTTVEDNERTVSVTVTELKPPEGADYAWHVHCEWYEGCFENATRVVITEDSTDDDSPYTMHVCGEHQAQASEM